MRNKVFTPIGIGWVRLLAKRYGLVKGNFDSEIGSFDSDESFTEFESYGINQASADFWPVISIYKDRDNNKCLFYLNEDPYIVPIIGVSIAGNHYMIEPGYPKHSTQSVERFEKYLKIAIEQFKKVDAEYVEKVGSPYPVKQLQKLGIKV